MSSAERYDLYLSQGCDELPDLSDLMAAIPSIAYPAFLEAIVMDLTQAIGFLHLDLTKELALTLLTRLRAHAAQGFIVQAAYRKPVLSREAAASIAIDEEVKVRAANPDIVFDEVKFADARPTTYDFMVLSKQLALEGYTPSGVYIHVDKLDGHIWHRQDFIDLYAESGEEQFSF